jgi:lipoyl(octanoyl) transferase
MKYLYLGRVGYPEALTLQQELAALRLSGRVEDVLLLLEHPPVLTLGRNARRTNILASETVLAQRGVTVHEINRGGDVTYHGPGQLIGYAIFDLRGLSHPKGARVGPVDFVRCLEEVLIGLCAVYGVRAGRIHGLTGVWCGDRLEPQFSAKTLPRAGKIGAIGIHVSRGITTHGFAFNVTTDLEFFRLINPCGITDRPVTSLEREVAEPASLPGLEAIALEVARQFGLIFDQPSVAISSLDDLRPPESCTREPETRSQVPGTPRRVPEADDTPLQIPPEVGRLRDPRPHPVRT